MIYFMHRLKRDKEEEEGSSNGGGSKSKEPELDENGYEIQQEEGQGKEEDKSKKDEGKKSSTGYSDNQKSEEKKGESKEGEVKDPKSGYSEEEPKAPKKDEKKEEGKSDKNSNKDFKLDTEGLLEDEIKDLNDFIKTHSINEKQAQAMVDQKKDDVKKYDTMVADDKSEVERKAQERRVAWHRELKEDSTFGGENFAHSIKQAEKVIDEHLPNLKKVLTEEGGMLPPYVMKDLAKLAGTLYSTEKLNQGEPADKGKEEDDENDPLAFYNS